MKPKYEYIYNDNCYICGDELSPRNRSVWNVIAILNNRKVTASQCVHCREITDRLLKSCVHNIPQKTEDECFWEMKKEGMSDKILIEREFNFMQVKH